MTPDRRQTVSSPPRAASSWIDWPRHHVVISLVGAIVASSFVLASLVARTPERNLTTGLATGASMFVSPAGTSSGDGSIERPFDLATALSAEGPVRPGTTVWLRGGTYTGTFRSDLAGTEQQPIVVRSYPGERAVIDSAPYAQPALMVNGAWATYQDFEIWNSSTGRDSTQLEASEPTDLERGPGVAVHGPHTRIMNLVVHDLAGGIDIWSDAVDAAALGNIIYNNGWRSGEKNNGHGIYTQNHDGVRLIADNVIFNQFAAGIHAYGSDAAFLDNIVLDGNVVFNNGVLGGKYDRNILIGGGSVAHHPVVTGNHSYFSSGRGIKFGQNNLGYLAGCADLEARDNVFVAAEFGFALELVNCTGAVRHNRFVGELRAVDGKTLVNHAQVKERFAENSYIERPLTGAEVYVRPASQQRNRATIVVYNWGRQKSVDVDLARGEVDRGAKYAIFDAQNYTAGPLTSGTYDGSPVTIPMSGLTAAAPTGEGIEAPAHTAPDFAVFVVAPAGDTPSLVSRAIAYLHRLL